MSDSCWTLLGHAATSRGYRILTGWGYFFIDYVHYHLECDRHLVSWILKNVCVTGRRLFLGELPSWQNKGMELGFQRIGQFR